MDKDIALMIVMTATRCAREVGDLAPLVKEHCSGAEYEKLPPLS